MPTCLIIDTSIQGVAMALASLPSTNAPTLLGETSGDEGASLLWQGQQNTNSGSLGAIARLMKEGLEATEHLVSDLSGICVSTGPGSFTGIKVGLAFAYGLRRAKPTQLPILTFGTSGLGCAAESMRSELGEASLALLLPATRTHGFMAVVDGGCENLHLIDVDPASPHGGNAKDLLAQLVRSGTKLMLCGQWPLLEELALLQHGCTGQSCGEGRHLTKHEASFVSRQAIYGMARRSARVWLNNSDIPKAHEQGRGTFSNGLSDGRFSDGFSGGFSTELPLPRYLRLSTAEERLKGAQAT